MPRLVEHEAAAGGRTQAWDHASEIDGKPRLRKQQLDSSDRCDGCADLCAAGSQVLRELAQDAVHFALLFFAETYQLVVQVDGFERLDEQRVSGSTGPMNDAGDLALLPRHHRHNEAIVSNGDEIFLQRAVLAVGAHETFERDLHLLLLLLDVAAHLVQHHTGVVRNGAVRKNLAAQLAKQWPQIGDVAGHGGDARKPFAGRAQQGSDLARLVEELCEVVNLACFERRALNLQQRYRGSGIGNGIESRTTGSAVLRGLR